MSDLQGEAWHNEQRRKMQDQIRVYNPTDKDYTLRWDDGGAVSKFVVPAKDKDMGWGKGMRVMQRYLALKFTRELTTEIINSKFNEILLEKKEKLEKQGATAVEYNANIQLMGTKYSDTSKADVRQPIEDEIWMGIEEEFGMDIEMTEPQQVKPYGFEDPMKRLEGKRYVKPSETPSTVTTVAPEAKKMGRPPIKHDLTEVAV
jgi:hypothetical protein